MCGKSAKNGRIVRGAREGVWIYTSRITGEKYYEFSAARYKANKINAVKSRISEYEASIAAIQKRDYAIPKHNVNDLEVGKIGVIVDAANREFIVKVLQVVDTNNMIVRDSGDHVLWVRKSTAGLVDGKEVKLDEVFEVVRTRMYTTALGSSKTVFEIVPFHVPDE